MAGVNGNTSFPKPENCSCDHGKSYKAKGARRYKKGEEKHGLLILSRLQEVPNAKPIVIYPSSDNCGNLVVKWGAPGSEETVFHEPLPGEIDSGKSSFVEDVIDAKPAIKMTLHKKHPSEDWKTLWPKIRPMVGDPPVSQ